MYLDRDDGMSKVKPEKIQIVEIQIQDKARVNLVRYELDVIEVKFDGKMYTLKIMAKDKERKYFAANNIKYTVVLEDAVTKVEWLGYKKVKKPITILKTPITGISGQSGSGIPDLIIETPFFIYKL